MLVLAASLIGSFILWSVVFADETDDDDDQGGFDDNRPKGGCAVSYENNTVYPLSPLYYY